MTVVFDALHRSPPALLLGSVFSLATTMLSVASLSPKQGGPLVDAFDTGTALAILGGIATIIISLATLVISTRSKIYEQQMAAFTELAHERQTMVADLRTLLDCANAEIKTLRNVIDGQEEVLAEYQKQGIPKQK